MNNKCKTHREYVKSLKQHTLLIHLIRIILALGFIIMWETAARTGLIDAFIFSSPKRIADCFIDLLKEKILLKHIYVTIYETLICFAIVMAASVLSAILMWWWRSLFEIFEPFLILLNSLPKSALAPVLIVWLGNNQKTIITAAISVAVFGSIMSIYSSFIETDIEKIKLIETLGGKKRHSLFLLVIPSSFPTIINTMKVNLGLSLVGVIIGEFLAAKKGLGYLIIYGSQIFKMDWVLMAIGILAVLSIILYFLINLLEKIVKKRWS